MGTVEPTREQIKALSEGDMEAALVMLNLLRFRELAAYPEGFDADPCSGEQAYARYAEGALAALARIGGRPIWAAEAREVVIGPDSERWDRALLVHYPSRAKFIEMQMDPDYQAILPHRTAALEDSRLILCADDGAPDAGRSAGLA
jgi:uncharacterized protein (DUF1330 family)